jgi:hypothetical protein
VTDKNFNFHNPNLCVCAECNCGEHLCKLHIVKPEMIKISSYKNSYQPKKVIPNMITIQSDHPQLKGPYLNMNSTYNSNFNGLKAERVLSAHPKDQI